MKLNFKRKFPLPKTLWKNPIHFIAFGFGSGASPVAPGTCGTVAAIPIYLLIQNLPLLQYGVIVLVASLIGIWLCDVTEKAVGVHDHPGIVWDEICGYGLTMFAAPKGWLWIILGFLLFRLFDIWKPWPIGWIDKHVDGGLGVMVDDLLAAVYAWIVLQAFVHFLN